MQVWQMASWVPQIQEIATMMTSNGTIGFLPTFRRNLGYECTQVHDFWLPPHVSCSHNARTTVCCPGSKTPGQCQSHFVISGFLHQKTLRCCHGNGAHYGFSTPHQACSTQGTMCSGTLLVPEYAVESPSGLAPDPFGASSITFQTGHKVTFWAAIFRN